MKVLLIGASGVVGRQLLPQLAAAGHEVTATTHSSQIADLPAGATSIHLDLLDGGAVRDVVEALRPDAIIHQATALSGLSNNLRRFDRTFATTNRLRTQGTSSLLAAALQAGTPRVIVQSFCGWPWAPTGGPVKSEGDPLDPDPPKAFRATFAAIGELERAVEQYPEGVVLRYGGLYGPGTSLAADGEHFKAIRAGWFPLVGDGAGVWSFVHTADAASAAVAALDHGRGIYNIVDDEPAPVREWLPELARLVGGRAPRRIPVWLARLVGGEGLVRMTTTVRGSSNAKAKAELGWTPRYPSWRTGMAAELASAGAHTGN
jgi:nucleoside-diphosphate-sugar epimerase